MKESCDYCAVRGCEGSCRKRRWKFAIGTMVRVRGVRGYARIECRYPGLAHGAVTLDRPLDGLRWWNEDALIRVRAGAARVRR